VKPDPEHLLAIAEAQHKAYKHATRRLQHRRRLEQVREPDLTAWLAAVERDDRTDPAECEVGIEEQVTT
jgi:hypothetical protein